MTILQIEQEKWYRILAEEKFPEIEDVSKEDRPLKRWSGYCELKDGMTGEWAEDPKQKQRDLFHHPNFATFCSIICEHGNYSLEPGDVSEILRLTLDGLTCREIGKALDIYYTTVFRTQKRLIECANLI